jgi:hypothetical protein
MKLEKWKDYLCIEKKCLPNYSGRRVGKGSGQILLSQLQKRWRKPSGPVFFKATTDPSAHHPQAEESAWGPVRAG